MRIRHLILAIIFFILCSSNARASITAFWQRVTITPAAIMDDPTLADFQCWDLKVTITQNWLSAGMRAILPSGMFYNHPFGGNVPPNPALFGLIPALEFDTYVSGNSDNGNNTTIILGGFPETQPLSLSGNLISCSWSDLIPDTPGTYRIARLTFPLGTIPNVININDVGPQGRWSETTQGNPITTIEIPDIPEPTALGVLTTAGIVLRRYRAQNHCKDR